MIAAGTEVFWIQTDYSGNPVRVVKARTLGSSFRIVRSDQQEVELVNLDCLRCVPVSGLSLNDPGIVIERTKSERQGVSPPSDLLSRGQRRAQDAPLAALQTPPKSPKRESEFGSPKTTRRADALPLANVQAAEVVAFDFMNLFVRAWHAGKPTETHAVRSLFQTVASALRTLKASRFVFAMDGGHVHRSKLLPQYKAHRPPHDSNLVQQRELAEEAIRIAGIPAFRVHNWEADDVLASLVDRCPGLVICSSDKDLLALHGRCRIFHPWSGGGFVDPETKLGLPAGQVADYLALCGDTSDGIPGVKGVGEKTAAALLADHGSLECILTAAAMGKIPGAIGKKLNEQRDAALMCREVVQLRESLPLPELLPWTPPIGFQQGLQSIGLGSVAAILDGVLSVARSVSDRDSGPSIELPLSRPEDRSGYDNTTTPESASPFLSAPTGQGEQSGRDEFLPDQQELQPVQPSRASQAESNSPPEPVVPAEPSSRSASILPAAGSAAIRVTRAMSAPIRQGLTFAARWDSEDRGMISCWEAGREAAARGSENPWKPETPNWFAFGQGFKGLDLDVFWYPPDFQHPTKEKPPRHDPPPQKRRPAGSLF